MLNKDRDECYISSASVNPGENNKRRNLHGVLTVVGSVIYMLYLGCCFLWGNISIYVLSLFRQKQPDASYDFIFLVDSFLVLASYVGYQVGTYLF